MKDFESVEVRAYTGDTDLLTEQSNLVDTTYVLDHTDEYKQMLHIPEGERPTDAQRKIYYAQRRYIIPTLNRGQIVKFEFLNAAHSETMPSIWLDILHKGIKLKFQKPQTYILGVPTDTAALLGIILGSIFLIFIVTNFDNKWVISLAVFSFGLVVQIPGAYAVKLWRRIRDWSFG